MICTQPDWFTFPPLTLANPFPKPLWVVWLSDGQRVYQDDGREGETPPSAWVRLGNHVRENNLSIIGMELWLGMDRKVVLPPNAKGYYFSRGAANTWDNSHSVEFYTCGHEYNGIVACQNFMLPNLEPMGQPAGKPAHLMCLPCYIANPIPPTNPVNTSQLTTMELTNV